MSDDTPSPIRIDDPTLRAGFVQLPRLILFARTLSPGAKLAYATLLHYAWQDGSCFPGQARMAADLGLSRQSVSKHLAELREVGAILVERRGLNRTNLYILPVLDPARLAQTDVKKTRHPDVNEARPLVVTKTRQPDVQKTRRNVHADQPYPGGRSSPPTPTDKYSRGRYAVCARCGSRPCVC